MVNTTKDLDGNGAVVQRSDWKGKDYVGGRWQWREVWGGDKSGW